MPKITFKNILLLFVLLVSIELWSLNTIDLLLWKMLQIPIIIWLVLYFIYVPNRFSNNMHFRGVVFLFMLLPILSIYPCAVYNNQSVDLSFIVLRRNLFWLFYFVLHYMKFEKKDVFKFLIFIAFIYVIIQIIQQLTFPVFYFSRIYDFREKGIDTRLGFYRFSISGLSFTVLVLYYYIDKFVTLRRAKDLFRAFVMGVGVFLCLTRQIIGATLFCIMISGIIGSKNKRNVVFFIISLFSIYIIFLFRDAIFGEMVKLTAEQIDDNIRYLTYDYFLNHWNHWTCFVFGNGIAHDTSSYGKMLEYLSRVNGMFLNDIGIVGILYQFGIIYVLVFLWLYLYKLVKLFKYIDLYLKLYIISSFLIIPMIFPFWDGIDFVFFSLLLYLIDLSIVQNVKGS